MEPTYKNDTFYRFNIGKFKCLAVSDGTYRYNPAHLFNDKSDEEIKHILDRNDISLDGLISPYTFLFVDTGDSKVLVDMGAGNLAPTTGQMVFNLRQAGIEPQDIDVIIISHAHPDHIGGTLNAQGEPNYPNARYYMWDAEWNFWFSDESIKEVEKSLSKLIPAEAFMHIARSQLSPIRDRIHMISAEGELMKGITVYFAPGHTPGHLVVAFHSDSDELFVTSDTVLFPLFLEDPSLLTCMDISLEDAKRSKEKIFDLVAERQALILAQHFDPFPSMGRVRKSKRGWEWIPISVGI